MVEVSSTIECTSRVGSGKGSSRKLRAEGFVPVVAYGPGSQPRHLSLDPHLFGLQRREYGGSFIYDVAVDGGKGFKAFIKEVQRDPLSRKVIHVDLYEVDMAKPIRVEVPVELVGKPAGAVEGGLLSQVLRRVEVLCLPGKVPAKLTIDVSHLNIGQSVHSDSIELPAGVEITLRRAEAVATVVAPEVEEEPTPVEGELEALADGETPAEGEAAAPAEGAAEGDKKEEEKKEKK